MGQTSWIENLGLKPLEMEGGWYRELYRSPVVNLSGRSYGAAIYYLLQNGDRSVFHMLDVDELYFFLDGDPVEIFSLNGNRLEIRTLGSDFEKGHTRMISIPRGVWQASRLALGGNQALLSAVTFPAFQFEGFKLGVYSELVEICPAEHELILQLAKS